MFEAAELADSDAPGPELMLGDMVLARGVCVREAAEKASRSSGMPPIWWSTARCIC